MLKKWLLQTSSFAESNLCDTVGLCYKIKQVIEQSAFET